MTPTKDHLLTKDQELPLEVLTDLLGRVESATGADRELDARLWCAFTPHREFLCIAGRETRWGEFDPSAFNPKGSPGAGMMVFRRLDYVAGDDRRAGGPGARVQAFSCYPDYTASLDAALALCERQKASGIDAAQALHEALEDLANGGWRDDQPIGPQVARYLLAAMLRAIIAQGEPQ